MSTSCDPSYSTRNGVATARQTTIPCTADPKSNTTTDNVQQQSPLEILLCGELVSSYILSFLDLNSIRCFASCSVTCHAMATHNTLWKTLFDRFWSVFLGQEGGVTTCGATTTKGFWKQCFRNAYTHEHLLWVTHWNCIFPDSDEASLQPGRCCIPHDCMLESFPEEETVHSASHNLHLMCPTCRYHPCLHGTVPVDSALEQELNFQNQTLKEDPISTSRQRLIYAAQTENDTDELAGDRAATVTSARLIYYSTLYSVAKWCRSIYQELCTNKDILKKEVILPKVEPKKLQERAFQAFASAGSHGQNITNLDQYLSNGLNFLSDLLFFPIGSQSIESQQLKREIHEVSHFNT
jgi:hypothetical protein